MTAQNSTMGDEEQKASEYHPHMRGGIVGNWQPIKTADDARRLSNAMATDGHYPAGLSVCFSAGINGDSPNHCLFAFTDECVCTEDYKGEWMFTYEEVKELLESRDQQIALAAQSKGWVDGSAFELEQLVEQRCLEARIDEVNLHLFDPTDVAYPGIPCDHSAEVLNARLESLETELANLKQAQNKEK